MRDLRLNGIAVWGICLLAGQEGNQSRTGEGNERAARIASQSPLVESARHRLLHEAGRIQDRKLRMATLDAISNPVTCVVHRAGVNQARKTAIVRQLREQRLLDQDDRSGVFPPLLDEASGCPKLPQPFYSAPGSFFGGHHSYPGGLILHEALNELSSQNLTEAYRQIYGRDISITQDIMIAAPIWHDWAKTFVFQWNADGTEFQELSFGGSGDLKTGAHHILGIAEAIKRGLPPDFVITLASAHAAPVSGQEARVVSWIQTAAILAQTDPVDRGYLRRDAAGRLTLAAVRKLGEYSNTLAEYALHNLSDADFTFTGPAMADAERMLSALAPEFGFRATATAEYNNSFRNVVLSNVSAERLVIVYGNQGLQGVKLELGKIRLKLAR